MKLLLSLFLAQTTCFLFSDAAAAKIKLKHLDTQRKRILGNRILKEYMKNKAAHIPYNKTQTLTVVPQYATNYDNLEYVSVIYVGSRQVELDMIMDTGSSTLWLPGEECTEKACMSKHRYSHSQSSSFRKMENEWALNVTYGDGSHAFGYYATDTVWLGDGTDRLEISGQILGIATQMSSNMENRDFDGIFGLGFTKLDPCGHDPPMINAMKAGKLDENIFTVWLGGQDDKENGGQFTYGGLDTEHCGDVIAYEKVHPAAYWQFDMKSIGVDGYSSPAASAISDTGTSFIYGPEGVIRQIAKKLSATEVYYGDGIAYDVECSKVNSYLVIKIGSKTYKITPENYLLRYNNEDGCMLCLGSMSSFGFGASYILGDVFIRQYCQIYDMGKERIGFAPSLTTSSVSGSNWSQFACVNGLLIPLVFMILRPSSNL